MRPTRAENETLIVKLFSTLSEHTIRMRFFSRIKRLTHESLIRLCHLEYDREMAQVAVQHANGLRASCNRLDGIRRNVD